jgi:hypothetical protein
METEPDGPELWPKPDGLHFTLIRPNRGGGGERERGWASNILKVFPCFGQREREREREKDWTKSLLIICTMYHASGFAHDLGREY